MRHFSYVLIIAFIFASVSVVALESKEKIQIKNIKYIGNIRINNQTIKFYTKLEPSSYVDEDEINLAIKVLYKTKLFAKVHAYIDDEKNLVIKVQENPLINKVILKGNRLFNNKELLNNVIQSKPLTVFTETKLQSDLLNLISAYRSSGKIYTKVEYELNEVDINSVDLTFKIKEGRTSRIKDIRFIGNKKFSEDKLKQVIKIQNNDIVSQLFLAFSNARNYFSQKYLLANEELLRIFYLSNGYINSSIKSIAEVNGDSQVVLTFSIFEGKQYFFGKNRVDIEEKIQDQDLDLKKEISELIDKKGHETFNSSEVNTNVDRINKYLSRRGYIFAKVNPEYTKLEGDTIDITYKVLPGKKIYLNQIVIEGNDRTSDNVIRDKLSIVEGDAYNISEIQKSYRELVNTGFFERVEMNNYEVNDNEVNLHFNLKEKNTALLYLGGGISFPYGAFLKADFKDSNLFGSGKELSLSAEKNKYLLSTNLEVTENHFNNSNASLGVGLLYKKQNKPNTAFNSCDVGFFTKLSFKIKDHLMSSFRYSYKYNFIHLNNEHKDVIFKTTTSEKKDDEYLISSIGYTLTYNKLNSSYSSSGGEGYLLRISQELSGLGGNIHFLKSEFFSFYIHPILNSINPDIALRFKIAAGHIFSYINKPLSISQHFFKGGDEIRGFDPSGIGPRAKDKTSLGGKTYLNLTQQVDFPLPRLSNLIDIRGSFFIDYATLFGLDTSNNNEKSRRNRENESKLIRVSPGFGFSIPSPLGGGSRFRLDFGFPLVKEPYDIISSSNIKFSVESGI